MTRVQRQITLGLRQEGRSRVDWDGAYVRLGPALLRYLGRIARNRADAEDLLQETFERATRADRTLSEADVRPWLYRVATNLAIDRARRGQLIRWIPFTGREPDEGAAFDARADAVRVALRAIPPEQAGALVLRLHEGFSRTEIAKLMNVSERTVKDRLERGRENFAAAYRREESPDEPRT